MELASYTKKVAHIIMRGKSTEGVNRNEKL